MLKIYPLNRLGFRKGPAARFTRFRIINIEAGTGTFKNGSIPLGRLPGPEAVVSAGHWLSGEDAGPGGC